MKKYIFLLLLAVFFLNSYQAISNKESTIDSKSIYFEKETKDITAKELKTKFDFYKQDLVDPYQDQEDENQDINCSVLDQDCPETMGCYLTARGKRCLYHGSVGPNKTCESVNDCQPGLICVGWRNKTCQEYCEEDRDCGKGGLCVGSTENSKGGICIR